MDKKLLYVGKYYIDQEMREVEKIKEFANDLFHLLMKFGVTDPNAIKNPIEAVEQKLKECMPVKAGIEVPILNIAKLIDKEKEYNLVRKKSIFVVCHKYIDLLIFNGKYFDIMPTAKETITEALTPYLTDPDEIKLAERIEKFIDEGFELSDILGIVLERTDLLRHFHANRIEGKTILSSGDFIRRIKKPPTIM